MRARLFETLTISRAAGAVPRSRLALPVSLTMHAAAVAALLTLPLWMAAELPTVAQAPIHDVLATPTIVKIAPQPTPAPASDSRRVAPTRARAGGPAIPVPTEIPEGPPVPDAGPAIDAGTSMVVGTGCFDCTGPGGADGVGPTISDPGGQQQGPQVVLSGIDVAPPRKLRHVAPTYPELALRARVEGKVVIECTIDVSGRVDGARVLSGHPLLDASALQAVNQWVYTPTLLRGVPVAVLMTVTVGFTLSR